MKSTFKQMILGDDAKNHKIVEHEDGSVTLTPIQVMVIQQLLRRIPGVNGLIQSMFNVDNENLKEGIKKLVLSSMEDVTKYKELLSDLIDNQE